MPQKQRLTEFDASVYLTSEEAIAEFLTATLEEEDPRVFLMALRDVAKVRGVATIAKATGLGRESLYKALADGAKPRYDTVLKILRSLGVTVVVHPKIAPSGKAAVAAERRASAAARAARSPKRVGTPTAASAKG